MVRLFGFRETLSLDDRGRFRMPDTLAGALQQELGRLAPARPAAAFDRLALYFVPGTGQRIFLYPAPNVRLAVDSFESPPPGMDPEQVRRARDYFYQRMRFVEADKQNRFQLPDGLREHADIGEEADRVSLVAHNHWLALSRSDLAERRTQRNLEAFEAAAPDLLNPVYKRPEPPSEHSSEGDE